MLILISGCFIKVQKNKLLSVRGSGKGQKTNKSEQTAQQWDRGWGRPGGMGRPGTAGKPSPKPHLCLAPRRHGSQEKSCQQTLKGKSNFGRAPGTLSWHLDFLFLVLPPCSLPVLRKELAVNPPALFCILLNMTGEALAFLVLPQGGTQPASASAKIIINMRLIRDQCAS